MAAVGGRGPAAQQCSRDPGWRRRRVAAEPAAEQFHHVHFAMGVRRSALPGLGGLRATSAGAPNRTGPAPALRHHVEFLQVLVEVGVDAVDLGQRRPIELLQDRELGAGLGLDRLQRFGERFDDRGRRERIAIGLEIGLIEQVPDAAIEELDFLVAKIFDHAGDVPGDHRLVHCVRVDERELVGLELRELGLRGDLPGNAVVDVRAEAPFELLEKTRLALLQGIARSEASHLVFPHVGPARAIHEHLADAIEHPREGGDQAMNRDVPAIGENLRHIPGNRLPGRRFGRCRVHASREGSGIASVVSRTSEDEGAPTIAARALRGETVVPASLIAVGSTHHGHPFQLELPREIVERAQKPLETLNFCNAVGR